MNPLAEFMALVTNHQREKVDIVWSKKSWVHNIFRVWEMLFWRRAGIRSENTTSMWIDEETMTVRAVYKCYTWEATCAHFETAIRSLLSWRPEFRIVYVPHFAVPMGMPFSSIFNFAIAFDAAAGQASGSGLTQITATHTVTGSNTILFSGVYNDLAGYLSSKYNSVTMTETTSVAQGGGPGTCALPAQIAPTTGANTLEANRSSSGSGFFANGSSYTGVSQVSLSAALDTNNFTTAHSASTSALGLARTPSQSNCWMIIGGIRNGTVGGADSGYTNGTGRGTTTSGSCADSNGTITNGSPNTITANFSGAGESSSVGSIIAPVVAAATTLIGRRMLVGVGT